MSTPDAPVLAAAKAWQFSMSHIAHCGWDPELGRRPETPDEFWPLLTADVQRYAILYVTPIVNAALAALTTQIAVEYVLAVPPVTEPEQDDLFTEAS